MSQLSAEQKKRGVITYSSGNHGQAVAMVGKLLGIQATVVMPHNAPITKRVATEEYGATVVGCEAAQRLEIATKLQQENGYTMIPPFDHEEIIAGQGTATLEFHEQVKNIDLLLAPCGGGGLLSGSALASKHVSASCKVIGVEPETGDDATRSFKTKTLQRVENCLSIADGTRTPALGQKTFPLILQYVDDMKTVSEELIAEAVRFLFFRMKIVVEPSGALGVAAVLNGAARGAKRVGIILSGGNIDAPTTSGIPGSNVREK
jgi:threonine dehydratase